MLLVDIGNTRIKWAMGSSGSLAYKGAMEHNKPRSFEQALRQHWRGLMAPQRVIVSSVGGEEAATALSQYCLVNWGKKPEFVSVTAEACGVYNGYSNPQQLGVDRWVAMIAAWDRFHAAACVVDCGTALTIDALSADGHHLGGLIAPGLALMRNALGSGTHALRGCETGEIRLLATNTQDAIAAGSFFALAALIDSFVDKVQRRLGTAVRTIVTGGDAPYLLPSLSTHAILDPELVLHGLAVLSRSEP